MLTQQLLSRWLEDPQLYLIPQLYNSGQQHFVLSGITPAAKPAVLALLHRLLNRPLLFVCSDTYPVDEFGRSCAFYHQMFSGQGDDRLAVLPALEPGPYSGVSPHPEIQEERTLAFWKIFHSQLDILICPLTSLLTRLPDIRRSFEQVPVLSPGVEIAPEVLSQYLLRAGYFRDEPVLSVGSFSIRGGILDFFPPNAENPFRVEFFGDEIESIREFSVKSQRSIGPVQKTSPVPMRDQLVDETLLKDWAEEASRFAGFDPESDLLSQRMSCAQKGENFAGSEYLIPLLIPLNHTLLSMAPDFILVLDETSEWSQLTDRWWRSQTIAYEGARTQGVPALTPDNLFLNFEEIKPEIDRRSTIRLDQLGTTIGEKESHIICQTRPSKKYHGNIKELMADIQETSTHSTSMIFVQSALGKAERLYDIFREYDIACLRDFAEWQPEISASTTRGSSLPVICVGNVPEGFQVPANHLLLFGDEDIFDDVMGLAHPGKGKAKTASFISDFRELKPGDYVVHVDHGVGQFQGVREIVNEGVGREFMVLNYYGDARLYVPLERLDLIQKHSSGENVRLQLDKLGGSTWIRTKSRIKRSMQDMAEELLKLYAERRITPGFAFSLQGHWHQEFEEAFEFTETSDQLSAIRDVFKDMEAEVPMDRLLCGDVGFGKTEVAMRAAFKTCFDGKQVVVLAPTTVLVYQHYLRFKQRFTAFPMTVEMLSRFRSPQEQTDIVTRLADGKIDIIIGTHRLLSKDIQFRDLGLLIIDEEQQFGVAHKERLKQLKKHVDTLTMTATPIPRTLHMSLAGIRDMSVIETPPQDRLAIQTVVVPFSKQLIQNAIQQELARGGQVYFVHNRVESIYSVASMVQKICPDGRIVVGHGQMKEKELESAMLRIVRHEADVLISTTIIENGLDIPLVNTIIINRADRFGLAQLYQLRGRVGRSNRRAYAYLLIPPDKALPGEARQRLAAIKEFSDLGSGFKIAALDLELRGAGNLLGGEQHGHINAIGFDLYCQMLERTIDEMRGAEIIPELRTQINLKLAIKIPVSYIPEESQRLRTYKRISSLKSEVEVDSIRNELEDRYGTIPQEVENLMEYVRLRMVAERTLVQSIDKERDGVTIKFHEKTSVRPERLVEIVSSSPGVSVTPGGQLKIQSGSMMPSEVTSRIRSLLLDLSA